MRQLIVVGTRRAGRWLVRRATELSSVARSSQAEGSCPQCERGKLYGITVYRRNQTITRRMCDRCLHVEEA